MNLYYLENTMGQRIDLQDLDNYCLCTDVQGLGVEYDADYVSIGDVFVRDNRNISQGNIKMNLNFYQNPFDKLQKVSNFITQSDCLYLIYIPDTKDKTEYVRDVDITGFTKTSKQDGILTYQLELDCKSLFYTRNQKRFLIEKSEGEMRFDFRWDVRFNDYANRMITFDNDGNVKAPFTLQFDGYVEHPKVEILQGDIVTQTIVFDRIVQSDERIIYSSVDRDLHLYHVKNDGTKENMFNDFTLDQTVFFKLPIGTSTIRFTSDTGMMSRIYLNIYKYQKVV